MSLKYRIEIRWPLYHTALKRTYLLPPACHPSIELSRHRTSIIDRNLAASSVVAASFATTDPYTASSQPVPAPYFQIFS